MFGNPNISPQNEATPFHPRNPYGISKVTGFDLCRNYRETYGMYCVCGLLFNHESPRRGFEFVTRKITSRAAAIKLGLAKELRLGNLDARRDWGHSADYVRAMHAMLQQDAPDDYVIASGETHSVRELAEIAFAHVGLDYRDYVVVDQRFFRPAETGVLVGDASKAKRVLGWEASYTFEQLVKEMVEADLSELGAWRGPA
jgi:GDPmannose 4,6-dehydratase